MRRIKIIPLFAAFFLFSSGTVFAGVAGYEGRVIKEVAVSGNKMVAESVILSRIKTRRGDRFSKEAVNEDLKRLYKSEYFSAISIDVEPAEEGVRVTFVVKEKPMLKDIIFIGNSRIKSKKLKRMMKSKEGETLNETQIKEDIEKIKDFYEKKGFTLASIDYEISIDESAGRAIVTVDIKEGSRVHITAVEFTGNKVLGAKKILKVMRTRKDTLFTSGILKEEQFREDLRKIKALYQSKGYLDAEVEDVKREYNEKKTKVRLIINISEGRQYFAGVVEVSGNKKFPIDKIKGLVKLKEKDIFTPVVLNDDLKRLRDFYYSKGYLDADIRADTKVNEKTGRMDTAYRIKEGMITYVGRVVIRGNTRTKDIVIRREILAVPGEVCDSIKIKRSRERLQNLGYFKYVDISLLPTEVKGVKNVLVEVEEQKTGEISFGAGYSSIDYLIGFVELSQKNFDAANFPSFAGAGQKIRIRAEVGSQRQDYILSFTEPWFLGRRLSAGFDLFKKTRKYFSDFFDEERFGGDLRFGVGMGAYNRLDIIYGYQRIDITDVTEDASNLIKEEEGRRYVGSLGLGLTRDTRDRWVFPSRGYRISLRPEAAGIGGDTNFLKFTGSASIYLPLFFGHVLRFGAQGGIVDNYGTSDRVPIFDRFFLGGATTVRGFDYRAISPKDENNEPIGGNTMGMGTAEYIFPLITRVRGAVFFDIGGVFPDAGEFDINRLNGAVGVGVRLNLPIGPVQVDYGWPVITDDSNEGENGRFSFTMGSTF